MRKRPTRAIWIAGLLGSGLGGLTYYKYREDIRRARARIATGSEVAQTSAGPIEYAVAGNGPPVLVVHGAGGGFDQGMAFGQMLVDRFRVVAMSRFGYLRTPVPTDASAPAQADAHAALLDRLGIERAAVIGISAGAPSSLQFALRHPQRISALILVVPATYVPRPGGAPSLKTPPLIPIVAATALHSDFLFWTAIHLTRDTVIRSVLATPPTVVRNASADEQTRIDRVLELLLPVRPRRRGVMNDATVCSALPRYALERITAPTLAIGVADDLYGTFEAARYTAEQIPGARFVDYPTGGHLWVGHQQELAAEMAAFLKK